MVLGLGLAGMKAIYSVLVLTIFGGPSLSAAMGRLFVGLGLLAFAGPVAMWSVLVSASENLNGSRESTTFTRSVSVSFWVGTVFTLVSVGLLLAVKPCKFQPILEESKEEGEKESSLRDAEQDAC